jgi:glucose/arabinose dehydrogenase
LRIGFDFNLTEWMMNYLGLFLIFVLLTACNSGESSKPAAVPSPTIASSDVRPANSSCVSPAHKLQSVTYTLTDAFPGVTFARPLLALQAPGEEGRMFVVEQSGQIFTVNTTGTAKKSLFADLRNIVDSGPNEAGLLGMAFHPGYAKNGLIFLSYTTSDNPVAENGANLRSRISRFNATADHHSLKMGSERNLITLAQPYANHNGGHIAFHPTDGYLYTGFGDGGDAGDPGNRAQNKFSMLGKMLRIDVNVTDAEWKAGKHYKIPADNPYASGVSGLPEIYALGMRNPWRWSFDRQTGELWAADVGQDKWEEIDKITLGGNYGWRQREGKHCFNPAAFCETTGLIDPVVEYAHASGRCSVTGGHVYRGENHGLLKGQYLYGDFCTGEIWTVPTATANPTPKLLLDSPYMISSFGEDAAGEIYVVHLKGSVYRLTSSGATSDGTSVPTQLSQIGCEGESPRNVKN